MSCCKNILKVCTLLPDCMEGLFIHVPPAYAEEEITVQITNGKGQKITLTEAPVSGQVVILTQDYDAGFFNPYGGLYQLQYFTPAGQLVTFEQGGKQYDTISFEIGEFDSTTGELNAFL